MNVLKNMEAIFIVAVALSCATAAFAAPTVARNNAQLAAAGNGKMLQVVIVGKRLSAAQKAQLGK